MTKSFSKVFECIEDSGGDWWIFHNHAMRHISNGNGGLHCHDIEHGIELLKSSGHIIETPLERAIKETDETIWKALSPEGCKTYIKTIVKRLDRELREELS